MSTSKARLAELKRREDAIHTMPHDTVEQRIAAWRERETVAEGYADLFRAEMARRSDYDSVTSQALVWALADAEKMQRSAVEQVLKLEQQVARRTEGGSQ
jgi:hypothetical protein